MSSHRRVKDIAYDEDEIYSDEDGTYDDNDQGYTAEDKQNFADLTPVVQAHLIEADITATTQEIEEALWHYYWDVTKSVDYIKKQRVTQQTQAPPKQAKSKDRFDQAVSKHNTTNDNDLPLSSLPPEAWFDGVSWDDVPQHLMGRLEPSRPSRLKPRLLGGSSKLAKLAEERRRKAEAAKSSLQDTTNAPAINTTLSSLDRLSLNKSKEKRIDQPQTRKYPTKKKREVSPPPAPVPEATVDTTDDLPDLRAAPSDFGRTLSMSAGLGGERKMSIKDIFGDVGSVEVFETPSPDDVVLRAHGQSKSLNK